jgi:hypothetical protein
MRNRCNRIPSALKHGAYSGVSLLPGEDPAAFEKLISDLIAEYSPNGRHEEDIVSDMAHYIWRKQNLRTYSFAEKARDRFRAISDDAFSLSTFLPSDTRDPEEGCAAEQAAEDQARKELGPAWELVEVGKIATLGHLASELTIVERLDAMIDKCVKRLLLVRGLKSMSLASTSAPPARLPGPSRAA